jgi:hypothetical protein
LAAMAHLLDREFVWAWQYYQDWRTTQRDVEEKSA